VLACAPCAGYLLPTVVLDEAVIQAAFDEVVARGIAGVDDARIVAYAHYASVGGDSPGTLYVQGGLETIVRRELGTHAPRMYVNPERFAERLEHSTEMQIVQWIANPSIGWSLAVIGLAYEVDALAVIGLTPANEDGSSPSYDCHDGFRAAEVPQDSPYSPYF
jgi:hypothetical protein